MNQSEQLLTGKEQVALALKEADAADAAYSAVIIELHGPKATRWTITGSQACNSRINAALKAKLDADARFLHTMQMVRRFKN